MSIEKTVDELEKWHQLKNLSLGDLRPLETQASSSSANFAGNNSSIMGCSDNFTTGAQWLIDSSASRHMAGSNKDFYNYISNLRRESVKLADGSTQAIVGSGMVKCSPNMSLSSVLHVPAFPINLFVDQLYY